MAKMGRPHKDDKKSNAIGIRLSKEMYAQLVQYATDHELTITQVVQMALEKILQSPA